MNKLMGISAAAALLLLGGAASASQMQAKDSGWDVPGQHDSDTDAIYVSPQRLASDDAASIDQHHVLVPADQTASGMSEVNHAGSHADSPRSGTISGVSNQSMNPAINPDRQ